MARITVEDCLAIENNRFSLVCLAAKRAKQLLSGKQAVTDSKNKAVVTALREIAAGKVHYKTPHIESEVPTSETQGEEDIQ
ncbi:MAG: DNA-directed RNA polymerase subunit omega [Deltaproteobacteria bacterium]|nr:DNA-directed RNA polymerase subunit omega [Deltaproteobacteria bacterium]